MTLLRFINIHRLKVAHTPEQSIARVLESERLREDIVKQAKKVGTADVFHTCEVFVFVINCLGNLVAVICTSLFITSQGARAFPEAMV